MRRLARLFAPRVSTTIPHRQETIFRRIWQMARRRSNVSDRQWQVCRAVEAYVEADLEEWLWPSPPLAISRPAIPGGLR
jgi:hypothetical protein